MNSSKAKKENHQKNDAISSEPNEQAFAEIVTMIQCSRQKALASVNIALIDLYWQVGKVISRRISTDGWGKGTIRELSSYIQAQNPGVNGFSQQNLWRMRQFFETYRNYPKLSTMLRELPWSSNLHIVSKTKRPEEREFYLRMAIQNRWSVREVARQIDSALFERAILNPPKLSSALREMHPNAEAVFRDAYVIEFLELPDIYLESDLHKSLLNNLRHFLVELGHDFCFIGSEVPLQVGGRDFALDMLFFHRGLNCLIAIELKIGEFQPEHLGKLDFYLEALDRDIRKSHEGPSIGLLLCASKDNEVVELCFEPIAFPCIGC